MRFLSSLIDGISKHRPKDAGRFMAPYLVIVLTGLVALAFIQLSEVGDLQAEQVKANREGCERSNDSRVASIEEKRNDIAFTLGPQLRLWTAVIEQTPIQPGTPPAIVDAFNSLLQSLRKGIAYKREGIEKSISSQADVAIRPGSPVVDCEKAFP